MHLYLDALWRESASRALHALTLTVACAALPVSDSTATHVVLHHGQDFLQKFPHRLVVTRIAHRCRHFRI
jgi:hypothetical protein